MSRKNRKNIILSIGDQRILAVAGESIGEAVSVRAHASLLNPPGFQNGFVKDLDQAAASISSVMDVLENHYPEAKEARQRRQVYVALGNDKLKTYTFSSSQYYQGVVKNISFQEVRAVIEQTKSVATLPLSEVVLETVPVSFIVNDLENVKDPIDLEAERLGVNLKIFTMDYQDFKNIQKALDVAEIEIKSFFPKMLSVSEAVLHSKEKSEGTVLIDVGYHETYFSLWKQDELVTTRVSQRGIDEVIGAVAQKWQIEFSDSLKVVELYGSLERELDYAEELIPLVIRDTQRKNQVRRLDFHNHFLENMESLFRDICGSVDEFINEMNVFYPHIVFTGAAVSYDGFSEMIHSQYQQDSRIGVSRGIKAPNELKVDPFWAPALGLLSWLAREEDKRDQLLESRNLFQKSISAARDWVTTYF